MQSSVDDRGRVLIPQSVRENTGMTRGTVVRVQQKGAVVEVIPTSKKQRRWKDLAGINPKRTGKPVWPTPEEIKSIWE
jgi:bifunctional DNA-binding transcriptional regulator/antitoxin component of YhaV-PrlF toxin-antitoxin module